MKKITSEKLKENLHLYIQNNIEDLIMEKGTAENYIENLEQDIEIKDKNLLKLIKKEMGNNKSLKYDDFENIEFKFKDSNEIFNMEEKKEGKKIKDNKIKLKEESNNSITININIDENEIYNSYEFSLTSDVFDIQYNVMNQENKYDSRRDDEILGL